MSKERRYDRYGEMRLMAEAEGWVMYRRPRAAARAMSRKAWDALPREPQASNAEGVQTHTGGSDVR